MAADINGQEFNIKGLIEHIRSDDEAERKITISQIPSLVLKSLRNNDKLIDQLLLVIYNLTTEEENHEALNAGNYTLIIRHLLRLYVDTVERHNQRQINNLVSQSLEDGDSVAIEQALDAIESRATVHLHPEALLMVKSLKAMR